MNFLGNIFACCCCVCIFELIISIIQSSNVIYGKKWDNLIIFLAPAYEAFFSLNKFCAVNRITCHSWNIYVVCRSRWWLSFLNFFSETCREFYRMEYMNCRCEKESPSIFVKMLHCRASEWTSIESICDGIFYSE